MKKLCQALTVSTLALTLSGSLAFAQDHHDDQKNHDQHAAARSDHGHADHGHYVHHQDWRRGGHISHQDWQRGSSVDWHAHHLRQPPRGDEWREVDGNYVLAAIATGVIASVVIASQGH